MPQVLPTPPEREEKEHPGFQIVRWLRPFGSGLVLLVFVNRKTVTIPYVLVLRCADSQVEKIAVSYLRSSVKKCVLKGKTVRAGETELNFELRLRNEDTDFVSELAEMEGVYSAVLVSYNGDYMS